MSLDPSNAPPRGLCDVDLRRAEGQAFLPLLGLREGGELFVKARGKELVIATGQVRLRSTRAWVYVDHIFTQYAFRFYFGLEGCLL